MRGALGTGACAGAAGTLPEAVAHGVDEALAERVPETHGAEGRAAVLAADGDLADVREAAAVVARGHGRGPAAALHEEHGDGRERAHAVHEHGLLLAARRGRAAHRLRERAQVVRARERAALPERVDDGRCRVLAGADVRERHDRVVQHRAVRVQRRLLHQHERAAVPVHAAPAPLRDALEAHVARPVHPPRVRLARKAVKRPVEDARPARHTHSQVRYFIVIRLWFCLGGVMR